MQNVERMSITLTPRQAEMVRSKVSEGAYTSNSEIMREALRMWELQQEIRDQKLAALRGDIQAGVDSGDAGELDFKELRRKAKAQRDNE